MSKLNKDATNIRETKQVIKPLKNRRISGEGILR